MSKISLKPNASGTGNFSIEAPNSNVDRTLALPDEAGTVLTDVSDIESQVKTANNATGSAPVYACRAWVNFDGTGTVSIRESGNVSSITDNGAGDYNINFASAIIDDDYAAVVSCVNRFPASSTNYSIGYATTDNVNPRAYNTTELRLQIKEGNGIAKDVSVISLAIFR